MDCIDGGCVSEVDGWSICGVGDVEVTMGDRSPAGIRLVAQRGAVALGMAP